MSRTIRKLTPLKKNGQRQDLRRQSEWSHKKAQAMLNDLVVDQELDIEFPLRLGNRALFHATPESRDDKTVAALGEAKYQRPIKRYHAV